VKIPATFRLYATLFVALQCFSQVHADEARVAVAANFATPLKTLAADFNKASGHRLLISPESTGKLYAQIKNGAPYDVLLSADQLTPSKLAKEGQAIAHTQFTYGTGKLVLWSSTPNTLGSMTEVLTTSQAKHLAIANPKTAPYGAAAVDALKNLGLYERWHPRFVQGENIAQTLQFVSTGNAELGFVAMSQVMQNGRFTTGSGWVVEPHLYAPIKQDAILLKNGETNKAALAWLDYLKSTAARTLIEQYGYGVD
jgi:molybdate transport system substrate-binding protein